MPPKYDLTELGRTGLQEYSGYVREEFLRELQGLRWFRVIRQMVDNDATIGAILYAIDMMIRQVNWEIQPASESNEDEQLAEFVRGALFEDMSHAWSDTLSEILSYLPWGFSYLEIVYKTRNGEGADPKTRSRFTDGKIGWRKWAIRAQETLSRWQFDPDGGIQGMWQRDPTGPGGEIFIPIDKALHFKTIGRKNNPEAKSILRNSYVSWYFKTKIGSIEAIGIERDLAGLPVAWVPPEYLNADAGSDYAAILTAIKNIVTNVRRDEQEGVVFPLQFDENGNKIFDFDLMSTGGTRQFNTNDIIQRYDQRIAASVLADFVLLGSKENTGSGKALAGDKMDLFATALTGFANQISEVINRHGIPRLMMLNGFKADKWPELKPGKIESVDLTVLGAYIKDLSAAGFPLFPTMDGRLEAHLLDAAGLPSPAPEAFVQQAEEAKAEQEAANAALARAQANPANEQSPDQDPSIASEQQKEFFNSKHNKDGKFGQGSNSGDSGGDGAGSAGAGSSGGGTAGKSFETHEEMSQWGEKNYGTWQKKLSKGEVESIQEYSQVSYGSTNEHLRTGRKLDPYIQGKVDATVKGLDSGLKKASLPEPVTVYRGMSSKHVPKVGESFTDKGFVSSSMDKSVAQKFAKNAKGGTMVEIRMPKGSHAAYINKMTSTKGEHELLIARNGKFKVVSSKKGHVVVDYIP